MVDLSQDMSKLDQYILDQLEEVGTPKILLINKMNLAETKDQVDSIIKKYEDLEEFEYIIPISALEEENFDQYFDAIYVD